MTSQQTHNNYPPFRRVMLASVKEDLYHPKLPSLRRMDMDDVTYKLPESHSRTTTACGPRHFNNDDVTNVLAPLGYTSIMDGGKLMERHAQIMNDANVTDDVIDEVVERPDPKHFRFSAHTVRYLGRPEVTDSSWRFSLVNTPNVDGYGRRPSPTDTSNPRRPQFPSSVNVNPWR